MNDQPMYDKPRRNLANIARKGLRHVYEYVKVEIKSGMSLKPWVKWCRQAHEGLVHPHGSKPTISSAHFEYLRIQKHLWDGPR